VCVLEPVGGQSPQKLVTEAGNAIVAGDADFVISWFRPVVEARYFEWERGKGLFHEHVRGSSRIVGTPDLIYIDEYTSPHGLNGRARAIGLLDECAPIPGGPQCRGVPAEDGRTVRTVLKKEVLPRTGFVVPGERRSRMILTVTAQSDISTLTRGFWWLATP